ncbi:unnamed protein product [Schistosoma bovis]|nr:unnamed protein product [Schistosoma bovis]
MPINNNNNNELKQNYEKYWIINKQDSNNYTLPQYNQYEQHISSNSHSSTLINSNLDYLQQSHHSNNNNDSLNLCKTMMNDEDLKNKSILSMNISTIDMINNTNNVTMATDTINSIMCNNNNQIIIIKKLILIILHNR